MTSCLSLGSPESYSLKGKTVVNITPAPCGKCSAVLCFAGHQKETASYVYEISVWFHCEGMIKMGKGAFKTQVCAPDDKPTTSKDSQISSPHQIPSPNPSTSSPCDFSVLWHSNGRRLCIIAGFEILLVDLIFTDMMTGSRVSLDWINTKCNDNYEDSLLTDSISLRFKKVKRILLSATSAHIFDMGRHILLGSNCGIIRKISWEGDIMENIGINTSDDLCRTWKVSTFKLASTQTEISKSDVSECSQKVESNDPQVSSDSQDSTYTDQNTDQTILHTMQSTLSSRNMFTISGWSEKLRMIIATLQDGSLLFIQSIRTGYRMTCRLHPVVIVRSPFSEGTGGATGGKVQEIILRKLICCCTFIYLFIYLHTCIYILYTYIY